MSGLGLRAAAGAAVALLGVSPVIADVTPRTVEVTMTATVAEAMGGGVVRRGAGPARPFELADLPDFPLLPGATISLGWRASGAGFEAFFDEDGLPLCQPFLLGGVSAGPARGSCTNHEAGATVLFASLPFADRLEGEPVAEGPNIYLGDYSVDLVYAPSTFWSAVCCAYSYDWDDGVFEREDEPGLFDATGLPHAAKGSFVGHRGLLMYEFDIDGDDVAGNGVANIRFDVDWRFRNYTTTSIPAPAAGLLLALGVVPLTRRRRRPVAR